MAMLALILLLYVEKVITSPFNEVFEEVKSI
jgi:hypothetical protein